MKTGKVAALLSVDPGTIKNWIARLPEFFTAVARGDGALHRDIEHRDLLALNTIRSLRDDGEQDWDKIRDMLTSGFRDDKLPFTGFTVDTGETALSQVERVLATTVNLENAMVKVDELEVEIDRLKTQLSHSDVERRKLERQLAELEKEKAVADALAQQELAFWRSGKLRYDDQQP